MESELSLDLHKAGGILTSLSWKKKPKDKNNPSLQDWKYVFPCFMFNKVEIKLGRIFLYAIQIQTIPFTKSLL